jgi:HK97 family phage major capsid protein
MIAAAQSVGLRHEASELEMRALSVGTTTAGGASVPDEMMRAYWDAQKWFGRVRNVSTVLTTTAGAPLPVPTTDDTANTGEIVTEASAVTTTVDPTFGVLNLGAYKFSSKALIVSVELIQDSFINLPEYLGRKLGERIARVQNTKYTTGTGTGEPNGVQVAAALGKTAAATNAVTFDEVIDLMHATDVAYRDRPGSGFMMHDTVAAYLRKLKDSQNRYLWEMSLQSGQPDRIFGKPVYINNDMDSALTTAKRLLLFGDFNAYHVREVGNTPTILRADELRILNHQVVFLAFARSDGGLAEANAVRYLRTA